MEIPLFLVPDKQDYELAYGREIYDSFDVTKKLNPAIPNLMSGWLPLIIGLPNLIRLRSYKTGETLSPIDETFIALIRPFLAASALRNYFAVGNVELTRSGPAKAESNGTGIDPEERRLIVSGLDAQAKRYATQLSAVAKSLELPDSCSPVTGIGNKQPSLVVLRPEDRRERF